MIQIPQTVENLEDGDWSLPTTSDLMNRESASAVAHDPTARYPGSGFRARSLRVVILALADMLTIATAGFGAYLIWANLIRNQPSAVYLQLIPMLALFLVTFAVGGLYPGFGLGAVETLRRLWLLGGSVFLVAASSSFALRVPHHYSRMAYIIAVSLSLIGLPIVRFTILSVLQRTKWWGEPVAIIGTSRLAQQTIRLLHSARSLGYRPVAVIPDGTATIGNSLEGVPIASSLNRAEALARQGIRTVLVVHTSSDSERQLVDYLQFHFRHVLLIRGGTGVPVEGVEIRNLGGILAIEFRNQLLKRRNRIIKRAVDILLGAFVLVASLPAIFAAAVLVKLFSRGPVFYTQMREGLGGAEIPVRKIRTMYIDAEERLHAHLEADPDARAEWEERYKLKRDPRVIPVVGAALRRSSADELPQLWNVLIGHMSLVGPRPFPEYHLNRFSPQFRRLRRRVRPGLSGLWQVMIRSDGRVEDQEMLDTYYIRNWSIWMDLYVLGKTAVAVLLGRGAR